MRKTNFSRFTRVRMKETAPIYKNRIMVIWRSLDINSAYHRTYDAYLLDDPECHLHIISDADIKETI